MKPILPQWPYNVSPDKRVCATIKFFEVSCEVVILEASLPVIFLLAISSEERLGWKAMGLLVSQTGTEKDSAI